MLLSKTDPIVDYLNKREAQQDNVKVLLMSPISIRAVGRRDAHQPIKTGLWAKLRELVGQS